MRSGASVCASVLLVALPDGSEYSLLRVDKRNGLAIVVFGGLNDTDSMVGRTR